eukprot:TRINITY_DN2993_c0_g1_i7.p1 TRINITY_DN2993_c0_g1~~TRINITY_DN2993_c0_g1_i7.p1  ORF type:complete len:533 (-),score=139.95 TRINITY_DN2993_c0_g1_i7:27-1493(-)
MGDSDKTLQEAASPSMPPAAAVEGPSNASTEHFSIGSPGPRPQPGSSPATPPGSPTRPVAAAARGDDESEAAEAAASSAAQARSARQQEWGDFYAARPGAGGAESAPRRGTGWSRLDRRDGPPPRNGGGGGPPLARPLGRPPQEDPLMEEERISHLLGKILRYHLTSCGLREDQDGFISVPELLKLPEFKDVTEELIRDVVRNSVGMRGPRFELRDCREQGEQKAGEDAADEPGPFVRAKYRHADSGSGGRGPPRNRGYGASYRAGGGYGGGYASGYGGGYGGHGGGYGRRRPQYGDQRERERERGPSGGFGYGTNGGWSAAAELERERAAARASSGDNGSGAGGGAWSSKPPSQKPPAREEESAEKESEHKSEEADEKADDATTASGGDGTTASGAKAAESTEASAAKEEQREDEEEAEPDEDTGAAEVWETYHEPDTGRAWFWNATTEEVFFADDKSSGWERFVSPEGKPWWWHEASGRFFNEEES